MSSQANHGEARNKRPKDNGKLPKRKAPPPPRRVVAKPERLEFGIEPLPKR